jgi:hypothetical protein
VKPHGDTARAALVRLSAAGCTAYCSYAICRTPLLPLFARDLGAGPAMIGFVMGASTLTGIAFTMAIVFFAASQHAPAGSRS